MAQVEREEAGDTNVILLLSLKLVLVAFFIMLNAISDLEEARTRQVLDSVQEAFHGQLEPTNTPALLNGSPGILPETQSLINDAGSLFESLVPTVRSTRTGRTEIVHIELPSVALFRVGKDDIRPDRKALVRRLAKALLQRRARDLVYKLEFLHGTPEDGAAGAKRRQEIRRASNVASLLVDEGLPPELLSIGVLPGRVGRIEFALSVRDDTPDAESPSDTGQESFQ